MHLHSTARRRATFISLLLAMIVRSGDARAQSRDPLPEPLRAQDVVSFVRSHRAEVTAARARARAAEQRPAIVSALSDPMVMVSADHIPFSGMGVDGSVLVQQDFPLSGVLGARRRAAEAGAQESRLRVSEATLDVELDALRAFFMLAGARRLVRVFDGQIAAARQLREAAVARYGAGRGLQADVLRAETEVARWTARRAALDGTIQSSEAVLNAALGRAADLVVPSLDAQARDQEPPSPQDLVAAALASRPELAAVRAAQRRTRADIDVMRAMYAPMAFVRTGPSYTMGDGAGVMVMLGVSVPIWRSRLSAGVEEARAMAQMTDADLVAMRTMIEGEVLAARGAVVSARSRWRSLRDEVEPRARQSLDATLAGFAAGQLPLVSVLETLSMLRMAQEERIMAEVELASAWARLARAIGRPMEVAP